MIVLYKFIGNHVTLVSHSKAVGTCLEAAKELSGSGIDAEVINLRSLRPLGMVFTDTKIAFTQFTL